MRLTTRIKAGMQMIAGNTKSALNTISLDSSSYRTGNPFGKDFWMFGNDGTDHYFSFTGAESSLKAYNECPPVSAIINRKAQAYVNGKTWILNTTGKAKGKESTSEVAVKIRKLLLKPNILQSGKQFEAQAYMYQQLYSYAVGLFIKPFGFQNSEASAMWIIPNWMLEVEESDHIFYKKDAQTIKKIVMTYKGQRAELPLENIFIIKDFSISFCSAILPESRIKSLEMPINNIIGSYESSNVLINRRGPNYLVSNASNDKVGTIPMTPEEKKETQKAFNGLGMRKWQSQAIITSASVNVASVGFDAAQLRLHEEIQENSKAICDRLGYPPHLLGLLDPTFNNQNAAEKGLYQNTIIPESESNYEQWNSIFNTEEFNISISKDYSHITVLQEDKKLFAEARQVLAQSLDKEFKNNWVTYNRVLELLGEDTVEWGNVYYRQLVEAGFVFGDTNTSLAIDSNGNVVTQNNN